MLNILSHIEVRLTNLDVSRVSSNNLTRKHSCKPLESSLPKKSSLESCRRKAGPGSTSTRKLRNPERSCALCWPKLKPCALFGLNVSQPTDFCQMSGEVPGSQDTSSQAADRIRAWKLGRHAWSQLLVTDGALPGTRLSSLQ